MLLKLMSRAIKIILETHHCGQHIFDDYERIARLITCEFR